MDTHLRFFAPRHSYYEKRKVIQITINLTAKQAYVFLHFLETLTHDNPFIEQASKKIYKDLNEACTCEFCGTKSLETVDEETFCRSCFADELREYEQQTTFREEIGGWE